MDKEILEERNRLYARAIVLIRQTAEDGALRKEQRLTIIRRTLKELDERLWLLQVKEAKDQWHSADAF